MRRRTLGLMILSGILLTGCSGSNEKKAQGPILPVKVAEVEQKDVPIYQETIGNVHPFLAVDVRPQVEGKLTEVHIVSGQKVQPGDSLFTVDQRPFQAALNRAQAVLERDKSALALAEKKVERYSELAKKEFVSPLTYEELQTAVDSSKAQVAIDEVEVELAQINLDYCSIAAPIGGKIDSYSADPGNIISPSNRDPLLVIRQLSPIIIRFTLAQKEFQHVKKTHSDGDMTIEIYLPEDPEKVAEGEVYFVDNTVDPKTGTICLKGILDNPEEYFWPGEFVRVKLLVRRQPDALIIPRSAVQMGQHGHYVYVVNDKGEAMPRPIKLGKRIDDEVIVETGLDRGETIVTDGQLNLFPGVRVIAVNRVENDEDKADS